jgi:hypothetical protein
MVTKVCKQACDSKASRLSESPCIPQLTDSVLAYLIVVMYLLEESGVKLCPSVFCRTTLTLLLLPVFFRILLPKVTLVVLSVAEQEERGIDYDFSENSETPTP